jgi:hypothetical protein
LDVRNHVPGIGRVPVPIEVVGHDPELDNEIARQVFEFDLAPRLPPQAEEGLFIIAHDDPGVRAADKRTTARSSRSHRTFLCHDRFSLNPELS